MPRQCIERINAGMSSPGTRRAANEVGRENDATSDSEKRGNYGSSLDCADEHPTVGGCRAKSQLAPNRSLGGGRQRRPPPPSAGGARRATPPIVNAGRSLPPACARQEPEDQMGAVMFAMPSGDGREVRFTAWPTTVAVYRSEDAHAGAVGSDGTLPDDRIGRGCHRVLSHGLDG
jgi:hypothetical protein